MHEGTGQTSWVDQQVHGGDIACDNNNNNITACPPMVSIPHQWLCLLWSKPRKNYEL
jgi:hypothetical protein